MLRLVSNALRPASLEGLCFSLVDFFWADFFKMLSRCLSLELSTDMGVAGSTCSALLRTTAVLARAALLRYVAHHCVLPGPLLRSFSAGDRPVMTPPGGSRDAR